LAQFPFWQSWLFVHEPPLAVLATQLPVPSQTSLVPQVVPGGALTWLLHTAVPLMQS
jgi:hypothetical protein